MAEASFRQTKIRYPAACSSRLLLRHRAILTTAKVGAMIGRVLFPAGLTTHLALGAGSWTARFYLGLPGLMDGGPADAVIYKHDPRNDLSELRRPLAVLRRRKLAYRTG